MRIKLSTLQKHSFEKYTLEIKICYAFFAISRVPKLVLPKSQKGVIFRFWFLFLYFFMYFFMYPAYASSTLCEFIPSCSAETWQQCLIASFLNKFNHFSFNSFTIFTSFEQVRAHSHPYYVRELAASRKSRECVGGASWSPFSWQMTYMHALKIFHPFWKQEFHEPFTGNKTPEP